MRNGKKFYEYSVLYEQCLLGLIGWDGVRSDAVESVTRSYSPLP